MVCGTIVRSSCSRSQGHSRRSLRVIASRRASASWISDPPAVTTAYFFLVVVDPVVGVVVEFVVVTVPVVGVVVWGVVVVATFGAL